MRFIFAVDYIYVAVPPPLLFQDQEASKCRLSMVLGKLKRLAVIVVIAEV